MKKLYLAWQDNLTRKWTPVGQLTKKGDSYVFAYTAGAKTLETFHGFGRMKDLEKTYVSDRLFPLFSNRILAKGRPEYKKYLEWLGLSETGYDDIEELSRTGGIRATDNLEIFPCPSPTADGMYKASFFCRGLKHLHHENIKRSSSLEIGEQLYVMKDLNNPHDSTALLLRSDQPITLVGYAPRYYSSEFSKLIELIDANEIKVNVESVNSEAPLQYRVRCLLECKWPSGFTSCEGPEYKLLS